MIVWDSALDGSVSMCSASETLATADGGGAWLQWDWGAFRDGVGNASACGPLRDLALV